jgi:dephospho-CoA kinase
MVILGITGGVATGKSTVTEMFAALGAPTLSADAIAREMLLPDQPATRAVLAAFPDARDTSVPGVDAIDRPALARIVFADPDARARLESLTHPPIIQRLADEIARLRSLPEPRAAAIEIPLLFEAHLEHLVDRTIVVACPEDVQVERLGLRSGLAPDEARRHIASQLPLAEKIARADIVIDSSGAPESLTPQVRKIWDNL